MIPLFHHDTGAVFLDRDGVISVEGGDYVTCPEELRLLPGAAEAIAQLNRAGWRVYLFTNQAGVGRGYFTAEILASIHVRLAEELALAGGHLDCLYVCPHAPDEACQCRKPKAGMLLRAAEEHGLDLTHCWVVGDSPRDISAGQTAGCHTILVLTGHTHTYDPNEFPEPQPELCLPDLLSTAHYLTAQE